MITVEQYLIHRELVADNEVPFGDLKSALQNLIVLHTIWGKVMFRRHDHQIIASFSDWQCVDNAIHLAAFTMRMEELGIGENVFTPNEMYSGQTLRRDH